MLDETCTRIRVGRLTALDPAAQNFQSYPECHVQKEDADYVDAYHTSAVVFDASVLDTLTGMKNSSKILSLNRCRSKLYVC